MNFVVGTAAALGLALLSVLWSIVFFGLGVVLPFRDLAVVLRAAFTAATLGLGFAIGAALTPRLMRKRPTEPTGHHSDDEVT